MSLHYIAGLIQTNHIPELLFERGIIRDFEGAFEMGLQVIGPPKSLHRIGGDPLARAILREDH